LRLYSPHLENVTALPYESQNFFHLTEGNVAFHHAVLKFSPCRNKMLPQLVCMYRGLVLDTRALAATKLGCRPTNLIFVEPGAKINGQY